MSYDGKKSWYSCHIYSMIRGLLVSHCLLISEKNFHGVHDEDIAQACLTDSKQAHNQLSNAAPF
jgi:hypothetical protein